MAKRKQTKKYRIRIDNIFNALCVMCFITFALFMLSKTCLKSYNVSLVARQQSNLNQIQQVKAEVDTINVTVKNLMDYNRVAGIVNTSD